MNTFDFFNLLGVSMHGTSMTHSSHEARNILSTVTTGVMGYIAVMAAMDWTQAATGLAAFGAVVVAGGLAGANQIDNYLISRRRRYEEANKESLGVMVRENSARIGQLEGTLKALREELANSEQELRKARHDYAGALESLRATNYDLIQARQQMSSIEDVAIRSRVDRERQVDDLQHQLMEARGRIAILEKKSGDGL